MALTFYVKDYIIPLGNLIHGQLSILWIPGTFLETMEGLMHDLSRNSGLSTHSALDRG